VKKIRAHVSAVNMTEDIARAARIRLANRNLARRLALWSVNHALRGWAWRTYTILADESISEAFLCTDVIYA
jgi:hypothetical protein